MAKEIDKKVGNLTIYSDGTFKLNGVVAAFPNVIVAKPVLDNPDPKFTVSILMDSDKFAEEIKALDEHIKKIATEKKLWPIASDKRCLRNGSDIGNEAYEGWHRLNMGANPNYPPVLRINGEKKSREEDRDELDEVVKHGAVVQVLGSIYTISNNYGKRASCNLVAINFTGKTVELSLGGGASDDDDVWSDDDDL